MTALRRLASHNHAAALLLLALALLMKLAVPAGFMPDTTGGEIRLVLCSGYGPEQMATMAMPMPGDAHHHDDQRGPDHKMAPCGFFGHAAGAMAMADPIVLALALIFIVATVFRRPERRQTIAPPFLRPPLRGPPTRS